MIDLSAIIKIESGGDPKAYNKKSGARGLCQITPICLDEWNNFHPKYKISLGRLYDPRINKMIAEWYLNERIPAMLRYWGIAVTVEMVLGAYNWGPNNVRKFMDKEIEALPKETANYIAKYKELTK